MFLFSSLFAINQYTFVFLKSVFSLRTTYRDEANTVTGDTLLKEVRLNNPADTRGKETAILISSYRYSNVIFPEIYFVHLSLFIDNVIVQLLSIHVIQVYVRMSH